VFELKLSVFQGPLDLLLELIEKEELDITGVSLAQVTDQYWAHLRSAEGLDAEALVEFIALGARLLYIKSRALLPEARPRQPEAEEKDAGEALAHATGANLPFDPFAEPQTRSAQVAAWARWIEENRLRPTSRRGPGTRPATRPAR